MKKYCISLLLLLMCSLTAFAQSKPSVTIFGDSYSTFEGYLTPDTMETWYFHNRPDPNRTDVSSVRQTWWWQVANEGGYKLCVNNSYSGSTIGYRGYDGNDYADRSFITRMDALGTPDVLLVFGATNDSWAGEPVGEYKYSGWTKGDFYTFRPAMAYMLQHIVNRYTNTEIYFILNTELRDDITESCKTICQHYGVPCIILHDIDKINGHPSIKGMRAISQQILKAITK